MPIMNFGFEGSTNLLVNSCGIPYLAGWVEACIFSLIFFWLINTLFSVFWASPAQLINRTKVMKIWPKIMAKTTNNCVGITQ